MQGKCCNSYSWHVYPSVNSHALALRQNNARNRIRKSLLMDSPTVQGIRFYQIMLIKKCESIQLSRAKVLKKSG